MPEYRKCLVRGCDRPVFSRGLCARHYQSANYHRKRAKKSWADLEAAGLALPRGAQRRSDFTNQVAEALAQSDQPETTT